MKLKTGLLATTTALLVSACIPSVHPYYTASDVRSDPALLGEWRVPEDGKDPGAWRFEPGSDQSYRLTVTEKGGKQGRFDATLFELDGQRFLDLIPAECDYATNQADLVAFAMYPGHLLAHLDRVGPDLRMAFFDFEWLEQHLKENPKALPHLLDDRRILLTANTRQLQRFVLKHLGDDTLFSDYSELARPRTQQP